MNNNEPHRQQYRSESSGHNQRTERRRRRAPVVWGRGGGGDVPDPWAAIWPYVEPGSEGVPWWGTAGVALVAAVRSSQAVARRPRRAFSFGW
jgi:hypothetical protein